jgi:signal transduction histidine kinase
MSDTTIPAVTLDELRAMDLFAGVDDDALLERWAAAAVPRQLPAGTIVAEPNQPARGLHLILDGALGVMYVDEGDRVEREGTHAAPTWVGAIPSLTSGWHRVRMVADTDMRMATIDVDTFIDLVLATRPVFEHVMRTVRPVIGRVTAMEQNRERLASLGTMAAGLAHELNNPAAAARRAAADLKDVLHVLGTATERFVAADVSLERARALSEMKHELLEQAEGREELDTLDAADAEDALTDALTDLGVREPWKWVEPLAAAGVDAGWLARAAELAGPAATEACVSWVAGSLQADKLTAELTDATDRMGELVGAVKQYAYMDRGGLVEADVNEGIKTTLTILKHKLKHTSVKLDKQLDHDLPKMTVLGSELNQVWTNLIDNAIDALGDSGTLMIRTRRENECVVVEIGDDGPGIPAELQSRIFDPFFTTKDVGSGTGLGLDTARRIVVERHRGSLWFDSEPGRTVFHVSLPIDQRRT